MWINQYAYRYLMQYSLFNCLFKERLKEKSCNLFWGGWKIMKFDFSIFRESLLALSHRYEHWLIQNLSYFVVSGGFYSHRINLHHLRKGENHNIVIDILQQLDVHPSVLICIRSFLTDRQQRACINGHTWSWKCELNHLFPLHYQNQYSTRSQAKAIVAVPPVGTKRAGKFIRNQSQ